MLRDSHIHESGIGKMAASSSLGSIGDVTGLTISGATDPFRRTDHADVTVYGVDGVVTTKGDTFMSVVNSGLSSEGRGKRIRYSPLCFYPKLLSFR